MRQERLQETRGLNPILIHPMDIWERAKMRADSEWHSHTNMLVITGESHGMGFRGLMLRRRLMRMLMMLCSTSWNLKKDTL